MLSVFTRFDVRLPPAKQQEGSFVKDNWIIKREFFFKRDQVLNDLLTRGPRFGDQQRFLSRLSVRAAMDAGTIL